MSTESMRRAGESLRRDVIEAMEEAAKGDRVPLRAGDAAVLSTPHLQVAAAPVAGLERIELAGILTGKRPLDGQPLMYWHLSGDRLREKHGAGGPRGDGADALTAGYYTLVADENDGTTAARLVDAASKTVARGNLTIVIDPPPTTTAEKPKVTGGIDSVDVGWTHIKVCGHVTVSEGSKSVSVSGCVEASL